MLPYPTDEAIKRIAGSLGFECSGNEIPGMVRAVNNVIDSYRRVEEIHDSLQAPAPHRAGGPPTSDSNPYGAWAWRAEIPGSPDGPLVGRKAAIKDNICVAGLPMANGSKALESYVPRTDATVVRRLLAAGAAITGKATCEDLCFSGHSFTSASGPVLNPYNVTRSSGGSSSGCAVLVATGEVDIAIGADQGGSVRGPAAWSGVCGLKPTFGLVPYTGAMPVEMTLDHLGPMARTVRGIAEVLEVVAGPDGEDPRQVGSRPFRPGELTGRLDGEVSGLRVGMISEGFGWPGLSDPQVDAAVREASLSLRTLGCRVETVSIPMHRDAAHIISPIMSQGSTTLMLHGDTMGNNWRGRYLTDLQEFFHENWSSRAKEISLSAKVDLLAGEYALQAGGAPYYGMAQNLIPVLTDQYDRALAGHDLLVMPTLPMMPREFIRNELDADEFTAWALNMSANNYAANLTGHPALSVPCAVIDGLPVGIMIVGPRGHDLEVLRLGDAFQRRLFEMPPPLPPNGHQHLHMQLKE